MGAVLAGNFVRVTVCLVKWAYVYDYDAINVPPQGR